MRVLQNRAMNLIHALALYNKGAEVEENRGNNNRDNLIRPLAPKCSHASQRAEVTEGFQWVEDNKVVGLHRVSRDAVNKEVYGTAVSVIFQRKEVVLRMQTNAQDKRAIGMGQNVIFPFQHPGNILKLPADRHTKFQLRRKSALTLPTSQRVPMSALPILKITSFANNASRINKFSPLKQNLPASSVFIYPALECPVVLPRN